MHKDDLRILNVAGPRTTDVLLEHGAGILVGAAESMRLGGIDAEPVLPEVSGETVTLYVKVHKNFLQWPIARFMIDWVFQVVMLLCLELA